MKSFHPREDGVPPPPPQLSERRVRPREGGSLPDPPSTNFTDAETKEGMHEMTHSPTNLLKTPPVGTKPSPDGARIEALVANTQTRDRDSGCNA